MQRLRDQTNTELPTPAGKNREELEQTGDRTFVTQAPVVPLLSLAVLAVTPPQLHTHKTGSKKHNEYPIPKAHLTL